MTDLEANRGKHNRPLPGGVSPSGLRTGHFVSKFSPTEPPAGWFWNYYFILLSVVGKRCWLWPSLVYEDIFNPPSLPLLPHFQFSYRNALLGLSTYKNEHVKEVYHESWKEFMKEKHLSSLNTVFPGVLHECIASINHRVVGSPVCSVEY